MKTTNRLFYMFIVFLCFIFTFSPDDIFADNVKCLSPKSQAKDLGVWGIAGLDYIGTGEKKYGGPSQEDLDREIIKSYFNILLKTLKGTKYFWEIKWQAVVITLLVENKVVSLRHFAVLIEKFSETDLQRNPLLLEFVTLLLSDILDSIPPAMASFIRDKAYELSKEEEYVYDPFDKLPEDIGPGIMGLFKQYAGKNFSIKKSVTKNKKFMNQVRMLDGLAYAYRHTHRALLDELLGHALWEFGLSGRGMEPKNDRKRDDQSIGSVLDESDPAQFLEKLRQKCFPKERDSVNVSLFRVNYAILQAARNAVIFDFVRDHVESPEGKAAPGINAHAIVHREEMQDLLSWIELIELAGGLHSKQGQRLFIERLHILYVTDEYSRTVPANDSLKVNLYDSSLGDLSLEAAEQLSKGDASRLWDVYLEYECPDYLTPVHKIMELLKGDEVFDEKTVQQIISYLLMIKIAARNSISICDDIVKNMGIPPEMVKVINRVPYVTGKKRQKNIARDFPQLPALRRLLASAA
jgi:hypothetical protein